MVGGPSDNGRRAILARMNSPALVVNSFAARRHAGGISSANAWTRKNGLPPTAPPTVGIILGLTSQARRFELIVHHRRPHLCLVARCRK